MKWSFNINANAAKVQIADTADFNLLPKLVALELSLGQQQVRTITLEFDSDTPIPVNRLVRLDYQPLTTRTYIKTIPTRRAVRFSITEKCNYRCFFCHEEGLEMGLTRRDAEETTVFRVFDQLKALGYNDFTFTGGEPLLKPRQILRYLDYMQQIEYLPDIKFVSNGRALNQTLIERLKSYPGEIRFNISMHSLDADRYHQIVHHFAERVSSTTDDLARVNANLIWLREANIPFKLNFVLLKGINTDLQDIEQIFDAALAMGAYRIKFLELLITQKLKHLYPYYYRLQALEDQLGDQLTFLKTGQRRKLYQYRDTPLQVELQSCTCSCGCNVCALNRDVNFTAELRYFPCFLHPEEGTDLKISSLTDAVDAGAIYIADMAHHFGDHSPIIIRDHFLTRQEVAYYYEIATANIALFLKHYALRDGLELERHRQLSEYYFSDGSDAFATFEYVRKLAINTYDHQATEITQQHSVDATGSGRIETSFGIESPSVACIQTYQHEMVHNGFQIVLETAWEIDYYGQRGSSAAGLSVSIGRLSGRDSALVRSDQPIINPPCPLKPLTQPVPAWLSALTESFRTTTL
ncbi:radical SAM protein [Chromatium okenii]|uniref:radical SAM protein n=1 Tax=Chromatium okenii TaxID=61644 RepID=UPI00190578DF|nr:radical SAM protein [Chromatium okenii]MBK1642913.1 radical SAM protein [Chromatium okenii]